MNNLPATTIGNALQLQAEGIEAKLAMANVMLKSGLVPNHFKNPEAIVTAVMYGSELGFSPMQALQSIIVIQGKPTVDAAGLQAMAISQGAIIEEIEHTDKVCRLRGTRGKSVREFAFSMDDARQMGLADKENWRKMPKDMLYARCVSRLVRRMFADRVRGFYSTEEMQDQILVEQPQSEREPQEQITFSAAPVPQIEQRFLYDIRGIAAEVKERAIMYLQKNGAKPDPETGFYVASERLKKLDPYCVVDNKGGTDEHN